MTTPPFAPTMSVDLTAQMNAWFAGLPDGAIADLGSGIYRCDGVVEVGHPLEILGGELRTDTLGLVDLPRYPKNRVHLLVSGDDVKVRGTKVNGPNVAGAHVADVELQHGFKVTGDRCLLDEVDVREVHGDGVKVAGGATGTIIQKGVFDSIGRQGMSFGESTDSLVKGAKITRVALSGIDIEPLGKKADGAWTIHETVTNVTIEECEFNQIVNAIIANLGGGWVDGLAVLRSKAIGQPFSVGARSPIQEDDGSCERRRRYTFDGNSSDTPYGGQGGGAMSFARIDQLKVANHTQPVKTARTGPPIQWLFTEDCTLL